MVTPYGSMTWKIVHISFRLPGIVLIAKPMPFDKIPERATTAGPTVVEKMFKLPQLVTVYSMDAIR